MILLDDDPVQRDWLVILQRANARKYNPYHLPGGSPEGGEFASAGITPATGDRGTLTRELLAYNGQTAPHGLHDAIDRVAQNLDPSVPHDARYQSVRAARLAWYDGEWSSPAIDMEKAAATIFALHPDDFVQHRFSLYGADETKMVGSIPAKDMVAAQYQATQQFYADHPAPDGSLDLVRGVHLKDVPDELKGMNVGDEKDVSVTQAPLSSWAVDYQTAESFAEHSDDQGFILHASVPTTRIFANGHSGMGQEDEYEHIVIGDQIRVHAERVK